MRGARVCVAHGGAAPQVKAAAEVRTELAKAQRAVVALGLPREVDPHQALLEEVWRAAGLVAWLGEFIAELEPTAEVSSWMALYQDERDRLVRAARVAIVAGVAERQVKLAEDQASILARVVNSILIDLGHDLKDQRTRDVVRLRLVEGAAASAGVAEALR